MKSVAHLHSRVCPAREDSVGNHSNSCNYRLNVNKEIVKPGQHKLQIFTTKFLRFTANDMKIGTRSDITVLQDLNGRVIGSGWTVWQRLYMYNILVTFYKNIYTTRVNNTVMCIVLEDM